MSSMATCGPGRVCETPALGGPIQRIDAYNAKHSSSTSQCALSTFTAIFFQFSLQKKQSMTKGMLK